MKINIKDTPIYSTRTFDKFTEKDSLKANRSLEIKTYSWSRSAEKGGEINLSLRYVKTKDIDTIVLDYNYSGGQWLFLHQGNLIFNVNDKKNIKLQPTQTDSGVGTNAAGQLNQLMGYKSSTLSTVSGAEVTETGYYQLSNDDFISLAQSEKFEIKISGKSQAWTINDPGLKTMKILLRSFYSDIFSSDNFDKFLDENNAVNVGKGEGCYIATTVYGNYNHPIVIDLRLFRDEILKKYFIGRKFINFYYKVSPDLSNIIAKKNIYKNISLLLIVKPLHFLSKKFFSYHLKNDN
jgi:hypothetical protein